MQQTIIFCTPMKERVVDSDLVAAVLSTVVCRGAENSLGRIDSDRHG